MERNTCPHCSKKFYNGSSRNRHIRKVHLLEVENTNQKTNHIFCPLCLADSKHNFATYILLMQHITDVHNIICKEEKLSFSSHEAFESWRALEERNVNYANERSVNCTDKKFVYYNCNRSNSHGYQSTATKRMVKNGGSIKINGVCPSRIIAHFKNDGQVEVNFVETHVGHTSSFRSRRLTNTQREELANKLKAGIPKRRIIKDAREMKDLANLSAQFNIENKRDPDDMIAVSIKVEEPNLESVAGDEIDKQNLSIDEVSEERLKLNKAAMEFISEKVENSNNEDEHHIETVNLDMYKEIFRQRACGLINDISNLETLKKTMSEVLSMFKKCSEGSCSKKRKMDKQTYFPDQKKQRRQQ